MRARGAERVERTDGRTGKRAKRESRRANKIMGSWLGEGADEYARKQTEQYADEGRMSERSGYQ